MSTPHCCSAGGLITADSKQQLRLPLSYQASVEIRACLAVCYSADHAERITTSDMTGQRASCPTWNTVAPVFQLLDIVNGVKPVKLSSQVTLKGECHQSGLQYKPIGFSPNMHLLFCASVKESHWAPLDGTVYLVVSESSEAVPLRIYTKARFSPHSPQKRMLIRC